jgi:hypothetical protein
MKTILLWLLLQVIVLSIITLVSFCFNVNPLPGCILIFIYNLPPFGGTWDLAKHLQNKYHNE